MAKVLDHAARRVFCDGISECAKWSDGLVHEAVFGWEREWFHESLSVCMKTGKGWH